MSKDKGGKNIKKAANTEGKKATSDYQAGKKTSGIADATPNQKKK